MRSTSDGFSVPVWRDGCRGMVRNRWRYAMNAETMPVEREVLAAYIREHGRTPMMEKFVMEVLEPF